MKRHDWLTVGFKLLGVYFGVSGLAALLATLGVMLSTHQDYGGVIKMGSQALVQHAAYLLAAYMLLWRTKSCMSMLGGNTDGETEGQGPSLR